SSRRRHTRSKRDWSSDVCSSDLSPFLSDPEARGRFRQQTAAFLASDKYRGLMIDLEDFPAKAQPDFVVLLNELSSDLHSKGMKLDRKSTRLNSSHVSISYAVFCL